MRWRYILLWMGLGIGVMLWLGNIASYSGEQAGFERGFKEGSEQGFRKGEYHGAVVGPGKFADLLRAKDELLVKATAKPKQKLEEFWEPTKFIGDDKKEKFFLRSQFASPPLIQTFEGMEDEVYHYVYCNDGTYAFPVGKWKFAEIYVVVQGGDRPPPEPRFFGGAEIRRAF